MCHSGTSPEPDGGDYAENGDFTLIRGLNRLSFLQYHPRSGHYALRGRLRNRRFVQRFFGGLRRASCLGTGRIADFNVVLYGSDLPYDAELFY